jgi:hypothetical protein
LKQQEELQKVRVEKDYQSQQLKQLEKESKEKVNKANVFLQDIEAL